jgi:hypothetical protein
MAMDWDKFDKEIDRAAQKAGDRTDEKLASRISSVSRLTDEEIQELFPDPADVKRLKDLMKVVKSAGDRNDKINTIVSNAEDFGGVILTLLGKFS